MKRLSGIRLYRRRPRRTIGLFKNGVFFDKKGTAFLLTEKDLCAIMSTVEKWG
mgnify:CR=1 FL=1